MAPMRSTLDSASYVTEATYSLPVQIALRDNQGKRVPRYTVITNRMTDLHLVTLPYEMAVLTITRWEVRAPYQAADSDRLI